MVSEKKINQVIKTINENGISSISDDELIKLLSILNKDELNYIESIAFEKFGNQLRISRIISIIKISIDEELLKNHDLYLKCVKAVSDNTYQEFIKSLKVDELGKLKKYLLNTCTKTNEESYSKLIAIITKELVEKESNKNLVF